MLNIFPSKLILAEQYLYYSLSTPNITDTTYLLLLVITSQWHPVSVTFLCAKKKKFFSFENFITTDHKHNINILDFITLITTLLYNTNINSFGAPVKILQHLQKCQVENADLWELLIYYYSTVTTSRGHSEWFASLDTHCDIITSFVTVSGMKNGERARHFSNRCNI